MTTAALLFAATFSVVLALGLQSLNVNGGHRWMAAITSFAISGSNLVLFKVLPGPTEPLQIAAYLLGGPIGIVVAMALHPRLVAWIKREARAPRVRFTRLSDAIDAVGCPPAPPMPPRPTKRPAPVDPLNQLAQDLLDPEVLGWQATPEIRKRAASALNP